MKIIRIGKIALVKVREGEYESKKASETCKGCVNYNSENGHCWCLDGPYFVEASKI